VLANVLTRLQNEDKISGVLPMENVYDIPDEQSLRYTAFSFLHLNPTTGFSSYLPDSYVSKPLVLLFDQFERAQYQRMMKPFIVSLAEESRLHKKFVVIDCKRSNVRRYHFRSHNQQVSEL